MARPVYRRPQPGDGASRPGLTTAAVPGTATEPWLPFAIFCVFTFVLIGRPQDYVPALQPLRLALVFTIVALVASIGSLRNGALLSRPESKAYVIFFLAMCAGIPFSLYRRASFEFVLMRYIVNVVFFLLFVVHVNSVRRFKQMVLVLSAAALLFSAIGLFGGEFRQGRFVTGSQMFDSNDVAFVELSLLPFTLCVLLGSFRWITKILALTTVGLGVILLLFTGSRGGVVGLAIVFLLFLVLRIVGVGKSRKLLVVAGLMIAAVTNLDKINVDRYRTIGNLEEDYNLSAETGRRAIWIRGMQLFASNPVFGVGVGRFGEAIGTMRREESQQEKWQTAHNSYIQVLTETGAVGGFGYFWVLFSSLWSLNRQRRAARSYEGSLKELAPFPGVLLIGFVGLLVAATFLSQGYSVAFPLFFAAAVALKTIAAPARPPAMADA